MQPLPAAEPEISKKDFLHPVLKGIILLTSSGLEPNEVASALATSGNPDAELDSRKRNSYQIDHLIESLCSQWSDDAIAKRDRYKKQHKAQANAIADLQTQLEVLSVAEEGHGTGRRRYG